MIRKNISAEHVEFSLIFTNEKKSSYGRSVKVVFTLEVDGDVDDYGQPYTTSWWDKDISMSSKDLLYFAANNHEGYLKLLEILPEEVDPEEFHIILEEVFTTGVEVQGEKK